MTFNGQEDVHQSFDIFDVTKELRISIYLSFFSRLFPVFVFWAKRRSGSEGLHKFLLLLLAAAATTDRRRRGDFFQALRKGAGAVRNEADVAVKKKKRD